MLTTSRASSLPLGRRYARLTLKRFQLGTKEILQTCPRILLYETLDNTPNGLLVLDLGMNRQHRMIIHSAKRKTRR